MKPGRFESNARVSGASLPLVIGFLFIPLIGCADAGPVRVPGSGHVTFDGKPIPSATISFLPDDGPAANGEVSTGSYTFTSSNGPVPGLQRVLIESQVSDKFAAATSGRWEFRYVVPVPGPFHKDFELSNATPP